jgi:hypothetical protein
MMPLPKNNLERTNEDTAQAARTAVRTKDFIESWVLKCANDLARFQHPFITAMCQMVSETSYGNRAHFLNSN